MNSTFNDQEIRMPVYELRTYKIVVGQMSRVVELYNTLGWPALSKYKKNLLGYFVGDVGALNEIVHIWKFDDEASRRLHWDQVFADPDFMAFAQQARPLFLSQENKLLLSAPWGPKL